MAGPAGWAKNKWALDVPVWRSSLGVNKRMVQDIDSLEAKLVTKLGVELWSLVVQQAPECTSELGRGMQLMPLQISQMLLWTELFLRTSSGVWVACR